MMVNMPLVIKYVSLILASGSLGDILIKVLGLLIGIAFFYIGFRFLFRSKQIIQGIQKYKYDRVAPPRKEEIIFSRIIGVLVMLLGAYFIFIASLALAS